jgi:hypothetical protein
MHTYFDFLTHVKNVEYILALLFIAGYILYSEVLKPKPFKTMVDTGKDDLDYVRKTGYRNTLKVVGKIAAAPFIGIAYVVMLPFAFLAALGSAVMGGALNFFGKTAVFGWRPTEAYLTGKKKKRQEEKEEKN